MLDFNITPDKKDQDALFIFMTVVAVIQGTLQLIQLMHTLIKFEPISMLQRDKYVRFKKQDTKWMQIEKFE